MSYFGLNATQNFQDLESEGICRCDDFLLIWQSIVTMLSENVSILITVDWCLRKVYI